jgi:outer membrane protein, multidrug efflux system
MSALSTRTIGVVIAASMLSACAVTRPAPDVEVRIPATWYAPPLAHQGSPKALVRWWEQFEDPLLSDWIARTQTLSPSVAAARAQVFAARANRLGSESAAGPQLGAVANAARVKAAATPIGTNVNAGLQASWAIDLWGGLGAGTAQARAQEDAAAAGWHAARVLVASELAQSYYGWRFCREQLAVTGGDRDSRVATAKAAADTERAGLTAPAVAALARASSADASSRYQQLAAQCEGQVKALVALTGLDEPELRGQLAAAPVLPSSPRLDAMLAVDTVPMDAIRQRPDVYQAQRNLVAASESVGVAKAALLPSLSFSGNWLHNRLTTSGNTSNFNTWSVGPLTLSLPLLGRDALQARTDAAQAQYESAATAYAATLRRAVAEVEQSLVALSSLGERVQSTQTAAAGYSQSFVATEARYGVGLANLTELEDARRLQLAARSAAVTLQLDRINAWINLYVALGGGFDPEGNANALKEPS